MKASKPCLYTNSKALPDNRHLTAFSADSVHQKKPSGGPKGLIGSPCHGAKEVRELGKRLAAVVQEDRVEDAYALLAPVLAQRTRFRLLDLIGEAVGLGPLPPVNAFLERIAVEKTEGGWVVMASAMAQQLERDPGGVFARCRDYVIRAGIWYATDIFGERLPGPALVSDFQATLARLVPWREDSNPWVRRTLGTAVHFWTKRSRGVPTKADQAKTLLDFLEPMFEEKDLNAVKGVGWGLKTLGRNYPELVVEWLTEQVVRRNRPYRALMLRKALTHLSPEQRARATGGKRQ